VQRTAGATGEGNVVSDTSPRDQAALLFNAKKAAARTPRPGEVAWRLRDAAGRRQRCELRDDAEAGAGWTVMLLEGDELLFSRRCLDEGIARYVATATKQDLLRTGWSEETADAAG
jgi:hypothetical protein